MGKRRKGRAVEAKAGRLAEEAKLAPGCEGCHAKGGEPCRDYIGRVKQMCRGRLDPPKKQRKPRGHLMKQGTLFDLWADAEREGRL